MHRPTKLFSGALYCRLIIIMPFGISATNSSCYCSMLTMCAPSFRTHPLPTTIITGLLHSPLPRRRSAPNRCPLRPRRRHLPLHLLRTSLLPPKIWTMVDTNPKTSSLDQRKFNHAVRLIQLHQNGQRPVDASLGVESGVVLRPVMFEGISGVSVPLPGGAAGGAGGAPPAQQQPPVQPQQQQAPPTPQPSQPPQPAAQPSSVDPSLSTTTALATQDPYSVLPSDLSRYSALFPQYAREDGFIYGPQAVALFSKSGADTAALRAIWTMVDSDPVDNRLDELEFALAMHLIVCVTKKGLSVPPSLPGSLKSLKEARKQAQQVGGGAAGGGNGGGGGVPPSPAPPTPSQMQGQPMPQMGQMGQGQGQGPPPMMPNMGVPPQQMQQPQMQGGQPQMQGGQPQMQQSMAGPPPLVPPGGASISDAFEGLGPDPTASASVGGGASVMTAGGTAGGASYTAGAGGGGGASYNAPPSPSPQAEAPPAVVVPNAVEVPEPAPVVAPATAPVAAVAPAADTTSTIPAPTPVAANRAAAAAAAPTATVPHDSHGELTTLQATLQKLQAENISLKAKLGDVTEEEAEVRKEIGQTVAEIGRLSQELTGLRDKVADAKAALIEATAELKAQKEKKG